MERTNLFLGSSIISKWDTSHFFPNQQNINLGISGLKSSDLNKKYSVLYTDKYKNLKIQNIILYVGSNDITQNKNENDIVKNIIEFIASIQSNFKKAKIFYISIFKSQDITTEQLNKIDFINKKLREYAVKTQNFFVYNFNRQLISKKLLLEDKKHLSEKGYQTLSNCIKKLFLL
jgi:lysophospholipase L1-like esterase